MKMAGKTIRDSRKSVKVFLVEDSDALRETLRENLESEGFATLTAAGARECMQKLPDGAADIILLDLQLPDGDGLTLMREIRKLTDVPIIVISGRDGMADRIVGLEMGADDYIVKPVEIPELVARIHAHLRRYESMQDKKEAVQQDDGENITFAGWTLDRARFQIFDKEGLTGNLTVQEFKLLEAMVLAPNRVLSREHLLGLTKERDFDVLDRSIDIQIARIRKKIGDNGRTPEIIKTVRGAGYMLVIEEGK